MTEQSSEQGPEREPETPEEAVERIREEIEILFRDYSAGIPSETLDTGDKDVPREKIRHPARATWFSQVNLVLNELTLYQSKRLVYVPTEILNKIEGYLEETSTISPHEPIEHQKITAATRLLKKISKVIQPGIQH